MRDATILSRCPYICRIWLLDKNLSEKIIPAVKMLNFKFKMHNLRNSFTYACNVIVYWYYLSTLPGVAVCSNNDILCCYRNALVIITTSIYSNDYLFAYWYDFWNKLSIYLPAGYGNVAPATSAGQSFCIFYAVFGIPLMLVSLAGIGQQQNRFIIHLRTKFFKRYCSHCSRLKYQENGVSIRCNYNHWIVHSSLLFQRQFFQAMENWSYRTSIYYCFITLLTVGFGDYVAGLCLDICIKWLHSSQCLSLGLSST